MKEFLRKIPMVRVLKDALGTVRIPVAVLTGKLRGAEDIITVITVGTGPDMAYIEDLVFGDNEVACQSGRRLLFGLRRFMLRSNADLLIVNSADDIIPRWLAGAKLFCLPVWMRGDTDLSRLAWLERSSANIKNDLRKIRMNRFDYTVTHDPARFDDFYHNMLLPHARHTHGKSAHLIGFQEIKDRMDRSDLLLIRRDGEYVAGEMLVYGDGKAHAWMLGVKDGNFAHVKAGALSACYYFSMHYLQEKGFERMHLGSSKAFLNDGVLQYKKKWGLELINARHSRFFLGVLRASGASKRFLVDNPFCHVVNNRFIGEYFTGSTDSMTEKDVRAIYNSFYFPGMKQINIHLLSGKPDEVDIPADIKENVRMFGPNAICTESMR